MRNHASLYMYADEATSICKDLISPLLHPLPLKASILTQIIYFFYQPPKQSVGEGFCMT